MNLPRPFRSLPLAAAVALLTSTLTGCLVVGYSSGSGAQVENEGPNTTAPAGSRSRIG